MPAGQVLAHHTHISQAAQLQAQASKPRPQGCGLGRLGQRRRSADFGQTRQAVADDCALERLEIEQRYYREVDDGSEPSLASAAPTDYYELLRVEETASPAQIKAAYRALQRLAHPDIAGDRAAAVSILLNLAASTLGDPSSRAAYDAELAQHRLHHDSFTGHPVSSWHGGPEQDKALLVDETACIGCTQCTGICPSVFHMEPDYGRARVKAQWADDPDAIAEAVDLCPVDCIHFVRRDQLALLEFVMKACHREDAAILARRRSGNMGSAPNSNSPFDRARIFMKHRKHAEQSLAAQPIGRSHNADLAAAIAGAWAALPRDVRAQGWPEWLPSDERSAPAVRAEGGQELGEFAGLGFAPGFKWMETGF